MKLPSSFYDLPKHQPLDLSPEDRAALPEIQWLSFGGPNYNFLRGKGALGAWQVGTPREDNPVELGYTAPPLPGQDPYCKTQTDGLDTDDLEWWMAFSRSHKQELGSVFNQDYAKVFVERARRLPAGGDARATLLGAGFSFAHGFEGNENNCPTTVWHLEDAKRGLFCVFLRDNNFWLTHEKRGAKYHTNLLSMSFGTVLQDNHWAPLVWSPEIANPLVACADMASYFVANWEPKLRPSAKRKGP